MSKPNTVKPQITSTSENTSNDMKVELKTAGVFVSALISIKAALRAIANLAIAANDIAELTQDAVSYGKQAIYTELDKI